MASFSKKYNLSIDELEYIEQLVESEGWELLLKKVFEAEVRDIEQQLLNVHLAGSANSIQEITVKKAEAQGARLLLKRIAALKQQRST